MTIPAPKAVVIEPPAHRGRKRPAPKKLSYSKRMIARAVAAEVATTGIAEEDIELLAPRERNRRLNERLRELKLLLGKEKISDRNFQRYFNGR